MNDIIKALILGVVEGLTEFLPVSSTGHLIIVNEFVNFKGSFAKMFDIVIQLGAILAVVVYFWKKLWPFGRNKTRLEKNEIWSTWFKTAVGVIPAIILSVLFWDRVQEYLFNPITVALALVIGGIALIFLEQRKKQGRIASVASLSYSTAFFIGLIQCLSMIPGTSRSAATIIGAMLLGATRVAAAEFSFYLAIPTILGASVFTLYKTGLSMSANEYLALATGFIVAFLVAWLVVAGFMRFISRRDFKPFGYYRMILGALVLLYFGFLK